MNLLNASFKFETGGKTYAVSFVGDRVLVTKDRRELVEVDNGSKRWRPCPTHARQLVKRTFFS